MLKLRKIEHQVLNAKQHAKEADIVASAGRSGTVTIATNMAGRGTDIKLTPESRAAGGLAIIGTERHESRRVDRQLRGRSGRQGDPGTSQFFVCLEDNLMRLFGSDRIAKIMDRLGLEEGEVIQHSMITKSIERAQKKVEENNFGIRKRLLEYDNVMNSQREVIYKRRKNAVFGERLDMDIMTMFYEAAHDVVEMNRGDLEALSISMVNILGVDIKFTGTEKFEDMVEEVYQKAYGHYQEKIAQIAEVTYPAFQEIYAQQGAVLSELYVTFTDGVKNIHILSNLKEAVDTQCRSLASGMEKTVTLAIIDQLWKEHLREMDDLRQQVSFSHLEQKDPLLIYKFGAFELFKNFLSDLNEQITSFMAKAHLFQQAEEERTVPVVQDARKVKQPKREKLTEQKEDLSSGSESQERAVEQSRQQPPVEVVRPIVSQKVANRNDKVTVRYMDGTTKTDKFKKLEEDLRNNRCVIVE
jgi:preprotein translocase subunit SecA